jgi:hypothetical protein
MIRCVFSILLVMSAFLSPAAQTPSKLDDFPFVSVLLPANIPSETVQISYFLIGPFGGYSGYAKQQPGLHSCEISALVDGKVASEIRMIVYASGCDIETFVLPLTKDPRVKQGFECQPATMVPLSGQIVPTELVRGNDAELVVEYVANWAHGFYPVADGFVTEFRVATVSPDENGFFQVGLPYFKADADADTAAACSSHRRASFRLRLRDSKTWNHIAANLAPEVPELRLKEQSLRIQPHYPNGLKFTARTF